MALKDELPSEIFNLILEVAPVGISLLKPGKDPEIWQDYIWVYRNLKVVEISPAAAENLGYPVSKVMGGFEKTGYTEVFHRAFTTGQIQEFYFHFGNEYTEASYFRLYLICFSNGYMGNYFLNINKEVIAKKKLEEEAEKLKKMNEMRVQNELEMVKLKGEIQALEAQLKALK